MDTRKVFFRQIILTSIILVVGGALSAGAVDWETVTSFKDVRRMRVIDDTLFLATSGGVLAISDPDSPGLTLTNLDGLGTVDVNDIAVDDYGVKWVAASGRLVKLDGTFSERFPTAPSPLNLRCLADDGDLIWIGSDSGLILFSKVLAGGGEFWFRYRLTTVNSFPDVFDLMLEDTLIWLATANGLIYADRRVPSDLGSPLQWTLLDMTTNPELNANEIRRVVRFEDSLYVTTSGRLFRMSIGAADTAFTQIFENSGRPIYDIGVDNDSLFVYHYWGLDVIKGGNRVRLSTSGMPSGSVTGYNNGTFRWLAASGGRGLFENRSGGFEEYPYTGIPGNRVTDITIDSYGCLTGGFSKWLMAELIDGLWVTQSYWPPSWTTALHTGPFGNTWLGTEGGGLWRADDTSFVNFNDSNSTIRGNNASHLFAWVADMVTGGSYLYACLRSPYNSYPVAIALLDGSGYPMAWDSLGLDDGITANDMRSIDYYEGRLAVGSANTGVFYCELGSDPFDKSDDFCVNFQPDDTTFIVSSVIRTVRFSPDGELWAGTNFGISRLDESLGQAGEIGRWVDVNLPEGLGPDISVLEFDTRGNVWVGAKNGLARFDASKGSFEVFTTSNSGLVSNEIKNLTLDPIRGDLYVSTAGGLSVVKSISGRLTSEIDSVLAFPNPYVVSSSDDLLRFNFAGRYKIRVFSVAGELVWEVAEFSDASWNGRNQHGEPVASGVYIFILQGEDGQVARGKFLLVRN